MLIKNITKHPINDSADKAAQALADSITRAIKQIPVPQGKDTINANSPVVNEDSVYTVVQEKPEFPDGQRGLDNWLIKTINYPEVAKRNGISGEVTVSFIIEKDGRVSNAKVVKDIGGGCGAEALKSVNQMPGWKPGKQNGKVVKVEYTLPVMFTLKQ